ncbi:galactokinase [Luoshenia tenuis]|jgi:galactokinase|uniref:galactokinase n=1 Tax=Luoshenia tenuis TaxID=2763654 RepID=UPI003D8E5066
MEYRKWMEYLGTSAGQDLLTQLYGAGQAAGALERYGQLMQQHVQRTGAQEIRLFSASGRTEVSGNHTDHNHGLVLAAGVTVDTLAVVSPRMDHIINVVSEGFPEAFEISLDALEVDEKAFGTTQAILRGIARNLCDQGFTLGGFDATVASSVPVGSGLSSSAAFEVLIVEIMNQLFCDGKIDGIARAQIGQYAENVYFGKPSGLMDQMACSLASMSLIDFEDPQKPKVERIAYDLEKAGYALVVVATGGDHADLTDAYAAIPQDMKAAANFMGKDFLRQVAVADFMAAIPQMREKIGERPILRALHFFDENARVLRQAQALRKGDVQTFLSLVIASGQSSWRLLQNCVVPGRLEQGLPLALALSERYLRPVGGAWRVHGGGFAGTIQAFVPLDEVEGYIAAMSEVFGPHSCTRLGVRNLGAMELKAEA